MFLDEVLIKITSGKGGDGIVAFRREKYVPNGGPAGGDGGKGGSVIFEADSGLNTLYDLKYLKHIRAKAGESGKIKNMRGADAKDVIIKVPTGTIIYDNQTNEVLCDLVEPHQQVVIAKGGKGGRGNQAFATSRNKAPRTQENGEPGVEIEARIELKLLADVGLVGFPSVGKSTIISMVSGSKPKIADYPFTTLIPNLGVVSVGEGHSFVLADMPGIIEGASLGQGLGLEFLKHIERTRVLIHVIDMSGYSERDPYEDFMTINNELSSYKFDLLNRPQIVVANKMDTDLAFNTLADFKKKLDEDIQIYEISAKSNQGLGPVMSRAYELLQETATFSLYDEKEVLDELIVEFKEEVQPFIITKIDDNTYDVSGPMVDKFYQRSNFMTDEAVTKFLSQLRKIGVDDALRLAGAKNGDTIQIIDFDLEFVE